MEPELHCIFVASREMHAQQVPAFLAAADAGAFRVTTLADEG